MTKPKSHCLQISEPDRSSSILETATICRHSPDCVPVPKSGKNRDLKECHSSESPTGRRWESLLTQLLICEIGPHVVLTTTKFGWFSSCSADVWKEHSALSY